MAHEARQLAATTANGAAVARIPAAPTEANKAIMRQYLDGFWNKTDPTAIDRFVAPDVVLHDQADAAVKGLAGLKLNARMLHGAMPDFRMTIDDLIAEGDRVVIRWTGRGAHRGDFQGIPPTHQRAAWTAISIVRIADGKIVEGWQEMDLFGLLQQLGVVPKGSLPAPMRWLIGLRGKLRAARRGAE